VALIGAPCSGKTVCALEVTAKLKKDGLIASFVTEYARQWMAKHQRFPEVVQDQFSIFRGQRRREYETMLSQEVVVTDCAAWLSVAYGSSLVRHGTDREDSDTIHLCDLIEDAVKHKYDLQYFAPRVFPLQTEDGRVQTDTKQIDDIEDRIKGTIKLFNFPVKFLPKDHTKWCGIITKDIQELVAERKEEEKELIASINDIKYRLEEFETPILDVEGYDPHCECGSLIPTCPSCYEMSVKYQKKQMDFYSNAKCDIETLLEIIDELQNGA
jgi:nicotinamide riboside kinase